MAEDISSRVAWALKKALTPKGTETGKGRGRATFVRRDERGTAWVRIPGNDFDTPVAGGIAADSEPGDTILYDISNGKVSITGNDTSPSVGERFVGRAIDPVRQSVAKMSNAVASSIGIAQAAQRVADAVNQHFWIDTSGIHVTEVSQEDWEDTGGSDYHSGSNVLLNAYGQLFRDGLTNLLAVLQSGVAIYDGTGNTASSIVASFTRSLIELGKNSADAVIRFCNGKGEIRYIQIEGGTTVDRLEIESNSGNLRLESWPESTDGTKTGKVLVDLLGDGVSTSAVQGHASIRAYDDWNNGNPDVELMGAIDVLSGYDDGSTRELPTVMARSGYLTLEDSSTGYLEAATTERVAHAMMQAKTAGDTITMDNVMAIGYLNAAKTYANLCIPLPYSFYGVTSATLSGTYKIRQYNGVFLFGSTASSAQSLSGRVSSVAVKDEGYILANVGTGSAQGSSATAQGLVMCQFNTLTITLR